MEKSHHRIIDSWADLNALSSDFPFLMKQKEKNLHGKVA